MTLNCELKPTLLCLYSLCHGILSQPQGQEIDAQNQHIRVSEGIQVVYEPGQEVALHPCGQYPGCTATFLSVITPQGHISYLALGFS